MNFSQQIILWYDKNKRSLPWRNCTDPYKIWLSEIILQQTRVEQGLPYFNSFIERYPNVELLAETSEREVLKLWQGLGYYSRARNMHLTAKQVTEKYKGTFPNDYKKILALKGVGPYTAAAICSFAYNLPFSVVDGNVIRLLSRFFGIRTPYDSSEGKKTFKQLAQELLLIEKAGVNNQAIMEFGALQCKPKSPDCNLCPLQNSCYAFNNNMVADLPKKSKKLKIRKRYFEFFIINQNGGIHIEKRVNGIWKGLYQFPILENEVQKSEKDIENSREWKKLFAKTTKILKISPIIKHQLTHQTIFARFWHVETKYAISKHFKCIGKNELKNYPIPRLLEKYLQNVGMI
ncbi:MAG: A/G-specific adenine glycosylase [Bacteroidota bacterium]|nr:A/G-specific adenine glycosylase [Bacteroidota bacterium]